VPAHLSATARLFNSSAKLALCLALASCSGRGALYVTDPVWEAAFADESGDILRGARDGGLSPDKSVLPMADSHAELFALVGGENTRRVILSPLLGLEARDLVAAFPGKLFIVPGAPPEEAFPGILAADSNKIPALGAMGKAAAAYLDGELRALKASDPSGGRPPPVAYAYAVFLDSMEEEAGAFDAGFRAEALARGGDPDALILERIADDRTVGESASRRVFDRDVRFLFAAAGASSKFFLGAVPARGCIAAGLGVRPLGASSPALAASLEEDYRAMTRLALGSASRAGDGPAPRADLRLAVIRKDIAKRIPYVAPH
jgi:hypothetical protein